MKYTFEDLARIMQRLRGRDGCPWDAEQTHESLKKNMIEETYEVIEAIDGGDMTKVYDELGDLLLQIVFHAQIASENGDFDISDVTNAICEKLIRRHPHVFSDVIVKNADEVLDNWDEIKKGERGQTSVSETLSSVPAYLPALMRAQKVQKKAAKVGFDWEDISGPLQKIREETEELESALAQKSNIEEELGDLLFSVVNASRFVKADPEEALTKATKKFISRFEKMEKAILEEGKKMDALSLEQLDTLWENTKK